MPDFIPSKHSFWGDIFFSIYLRISIFFHFNSISFEEVERDQAQTNNMDNSSSDQHSIWVLSNHYSWWDALIVYIWNKRYAKKKFHCMVLRDTLLKNPFLNKVGGYSVDPEKRSIITTLHYTSELLKDPKNLVLIFPQGKLSSNHISTIEFQSGFNRILSKLDNNAQKKVSIILMAGFIDYFSRRKPSVRIYVQTINKVDHDFDGKKRYNEFYQLAKMKQGSRTS